MRHLGPVEPIPRRVPPVREGRGDDRSGTRIVPVNDHGNYRCRIWRIDLQKRELVSVVLVDGGEASGRRRELCARRVSVEGDAAVRGERHCYLQAVSKRKDQRSRWAGADRPLAGDDRRRGNSAFSSRSAEASAPDGNRAHCWRRADRGWRGCGRERVHARG